MERKDDHIRYALMQKNEHNSFDKYELEYHSIPNFDISDIDISTKIGDLSLNFPFYINAITGGSVKGDNINKDLEYISKRTGIFLFPGSYSPFLGKDVSSYPKGQGSNLGIDKSVDKHLETISKSKSKIHQVHVNPIQEILMPEGDKNFKNWENNLKEIVKFSPVPIVLKETGFGMNEKTIEKAISLGIKIIDISGKGGTDFSIIENMRRKKPKYYYQEMGYTTVDSLLYAQKYSNNIEFLASGGIRNPLDIVKSLAFGAKAVGLSKTFLELLETKGKEEVINIMLEWIEDIKYIMLLTNSKNISELKGKVKLKNDK